MTENVLKKPPVLRSQKEEYGRTFLIALAVASLFFIPFIIYDNGYFLFYGDFNVQQVPFYQMCHEKVRSGGIFWDWQTDLGVNFIGSYSFYLLGSPFFWLTLPFPNWMVPYLMGPLLILKFACSAFTAYFYIRRFTKTPRTATLCSLLYAFSGFSVYNIFFNHFHEAIIFFPLLLLAVEQHIADNRRGVVALACFICAISNYFFFVGMVVFVIIYWFVRMLSNCWRLSMGRFLAFAGEAVLGLLMGSFLLLPAIYAVLQNPRVDRTSYSWNAVMYGREQIYFNIIQTFFFPPDLPARPVFFPSADVKWSSLGGWLPVFSMAGVFAWMQGKRGHWLRRIIGILILMAMVPILNSAFYMFNSAYYARWFYMPVLMMCLATAMAIEDRNVNWNTAYKWTLGVTLAITAVIGLMPDQRENGKYTRFGIFSYDKNNPNMYFTRFWVTCGIAIAGLIILRLLLNFIRKKPNTFYKMSIVCVCAVSVIYASFFIGNGKSHSNNTKDVIIPNLIEGNIELPGDRDTFRIDVYEGIDNTGMYLGYDSINSFHSIVPSSVMDYYPYVKEERGVASRPTLASPAIRPFLSVKYLLNPINKNNFINKDTGTKMPGWTYYGTQGGFKIYENQNYIPYGFTYDYYMTEEQCEAYGEHHHSDMMLKAVLLNNEQIKRHGDILRNLGNDYWIYNPDTDETPIKRSHQKDINFDDETFALDSENRANTAAYNFERDNRGFTANINQDKENLVFFSVPFEDGWSATVDGQAAQIEKVNVGFMAVRVPSGDHTIRFDYMPPGLVNGVKVSILAVAVLVIYLVLFKLYRRRYPEKCTSYYPEGEQLREQWERYDLKDAEEALLEDMSRTRFNESGDFVISNNEQDSQDDSTAEIDFTPGFNVDINDESEGNDEKMDEE